jgi:hypothetical protein
MMAAPALRADAFEPALIDFEVFALFLEARRIARAKTDFKVAREAGVELDAVHRAARARNPGAFQFFALCDWIGEDPATFLKRTARHG